MLQISCKSGFLEKTHCIIDWPRFCCSNGLLVVVIAILYLWLDSNRNRDTQVNVITKLPRLVNQRMEDFIVVACVERVKNIINTSTCTAHINRSSQLCGCIFPCLLSQTNQIHLGNSEVWCNKLNLLFLPLMQVGQVLDHQMHHVVWLKEILLEDHQ